MRKKVNYLNKSGLTILIGMAGLFIMACCGALLCKNRTGKFARLSLFVLLLISGLIIAPILPTFAVILCAIFGALWYSVNMLFLSQLVIPHELLEQVGTTNLTIIAIGFIGGLILIPTFLGLSTTIFMVSIVVAGFPALFTCLELEEHL